jgi:hypothetical protein
MNIQFSGHLKIVYSFNTPFIPKRKMFYRYSVRETTIYLSFTLDRLALYVLCLCVKNYLVILKV